ncbi:hypothetical protein H4R35_000389 [Dimargaris xerosporica]|nr:hypothetical protein H4R35_000389 [Dimargaris xerosporica]
MDPGPAYRFTSVDLYGQISPLGRAWFLATIRLTVNVNETQIALFQRPSVGNVHALQAHAVVTRPKPTPDESHQPGVLPDPILRSSATVRRTRSALSRTATTLRGSATVRATATPSMLPRRSTMESERRSGGEPSTSLGDGGASALPSPPRPVVRAPSAANLASPSVSKRACLCSDHKRRPPLPEGFGTIRKGYPRRNSRASLADLGMPCPDHGYQWAEAGLLSPKESEASLLMELQATDAYYAGDDTSDLLYFYATKAGDYQLTLVFCPPLTSLNHVFEDSLLPIAGASLPWVPEAVHNALTLVVAYPDPHALVSNTDAPTDALFLEAWILPAFRSKSALAPSDPVIQQYVAALCQALDQDQTFTGTLLDDSSNMAQEVRRELPWDTANTQVLAVQFGFASTTRLTFGWCPSDFPSDCRHLQRETLLQPPKYPDLSQESASLPNSPEAEVGELAASPNADDPPRRASTAQPTTGIHTQSTSVEDLRPGVHTTYSSSASAIANLAATAIAVTPSTWSVEMEQSAMLVFSPERWQYTAMINIQIDPTIVTPHSQPLNTNTHYTLVFALTAQAMDQVRLLQVESSLGAVQWQFEQPVAPTELPLAASAPSTQPAPSALLSTHTVTQATLRVWVASPTALSSLAFIFVFQGRPTTLTTISPLAGRRLSKDSSEQPRSKQLPAGPDFIPPLLTIPGAQKHIGCLAISSESPLLSIAQASMQGLFYLDSARASAALQHEVSSDIGSDHDEDFKGGYAGGSQDRQDPTSPSKSPSMMAVRGRSISFTDTRPQSYSAHFLVDEKLDISPVATARLKSESPDSCPRTPAQTSSWNYGGVLSKRRRRTMLWQLAHVRRMSMGPTALLSQAGRLSMAPSSNQLANSLLPKLLDASREMADGVSSDIDWSTFASPRVQLELESSHTSKAMAPPSPLDPPQTAGSLEPLTETRSISFMDPAPSLSPFASPTSSLASLASEPDPPDFTLATPEHPVVFRDYGYLEAEFILRLRLWTYPKTVSPLFTAESVMAQVTITPQQNSETAEPQVSASPRRVKNRTNNTTTRASVAPLKTMTTATMPNTSSTDRAKPLLLAQRTTGAHRVVVSLTATLNIDHDEVLAAFGRESHDDTTSDTSSHLSRTDTAATSYPLRGGHGPALSTVLSPPSYPHKPPSAFHDTPPYWPLGTSDHGSLASSMPLDPALPSQAMVAPLAKSAALGSGVGHGGGRRRGTTVSQLTSLCLRFPSTLDFQSVKWWIVKVGGKRAQAWLMPHNELWVPLMPYLEAMSRSQFTHLPRAYSRPEDQITVEVKLATTTAGPAMNDHHPLAPPAPSLLECCTHIHHPGDDPHWYPWAPEYSIPLPSLNVPVHGVRLDLAIPQSLLAFYQVRTAMFEFFPDEAPDQSSFGHRSFESALLEPGERPCLTIQPGQAWEPCPTLDTATSPTAKTESQGHHPQTSASPSMLQPGLNSQSLDQATQTDPATLLDPAIQDTLDHQRHAIVSLQRQLHRRNRWLYLLGIWLGMVCIVVGWAHRDYAAQRLMVAWERPADTWQWVTTAPLFSELAALLPENLTTATTAADANSSTAVVVVDHVATHTTPVHGKAWETIRADSGPLLRDQQHVSAPPAGTARLTTGGDDQPTDAMLTSTMAADGNQQQTTFLGQSAAPVLSFSLHPTATQPQSMEPAALRPPPSSETLEMLLQYGWRYVERTWMNFTARWRQWFAPLHE